MLAAVRPSPKGAPGMSTPAENAAAIHKLFDQFYGQRQMQLAAELFAPSGVMHDSVKGDEMVTPAEVQQGYQTQLSQNPDFTMTLLHTIAENDLVAYHWQITGSQPPAGSFSAQGMSIARFDGTGKIAELWRVFDQYTMFAQLSQGMQAMPGVTIQQIPGQPQPGGGRWNPNASPWGQG